MREICRNDAEMGQESDRVDVELSKKFCKNVAQMVIPSPCP